MDTENLPDQTELLALTVEIVSAYTENNALEMAAVPDLIGSVFAKLSELAAGKQAVPEVLTPAVPIRRSVTEDHIVCLEDGAKLTMLTRYLKVRFNLTPAQYRRRWSLPASYPMVAPGYAARRSAQAKRVGLGGKRPAPAAAEGKGRAEGARA